MAPLRTSTDGIVVHCSATDPDWHGRIGVEDIERWHLERGWSEIGYHLYIDRDGVLWTGRNLEEVGAHVRGHNDTTVAICLEGGVEVGWARTSHGAPEQVKVRSKPNFTEAQLQTLDATIQLLMALYPEAILRGHRDFEGVTKDCPSFDVRTWWEEGEVVP